VSLAKRIAGDTMAIMAVALCWMVLAPMVAGPVPQPQVQHTCPAPAVVHGVGSNLKTFAHRIDRCAQR
jgi:hypothetical protein